MTTPIRMTRRDFFEKLGKGSLVVGFSLSPVAASILAEKARAASLDSSLTITTGPLQNAASPPTDAWLTIDHQGKIALLSGKVELGTGTQTAFSQIVAEELYVDVSAITYVQGDTSQTPDQGTTAGSKSIQVQGPLVRRAAATAFQQLLSLASAYLGVSPGELVAKGGSIGIGAAMKRPTSYAKLFAGQQISLTSNSAAPLKAADNYTVVGQPVGRLDLFDKFTGKFSFVSDIVLPGMLHGRVVRNDIAPSGAVTSKPKNAIFLTLDDSAARAVPGFVQTVQNQNFVGVVATTEWGAIQAARGVHVTWQSGPALVSNSSQANLQAALTSSANTYATSSQEVVGNASSAFSTAPIKLADRKYYSPYHMHGSVGPCCAVASVTSEPDPDTGIQATVWSGTQGVYPLRQAVSDVLGLNDVSKVRVIYVEGAGCYGHNGADDVAVDAALMSQAVGAPVRVQWMRQDEHGWEPLGPAMAHTLNGALDAGGNVVSWSHEVWSPPHSSRPGGGGSLLAGQEIGLFPPSLPTAPVNQGTRNAPVNYNFPNMKLTAHHVRPYSTSPAASGIAAHPLVNTFPRSSALRSLGGMSNCFANESFMDELARTANADPIAFRKQYVCALSGGSGSAASVPVPGVDPRAAAALDAMAAQAGWGSGLAGPTKGDRVGKGVAFARYETVETYVAVYAEVEVSTVTGDVWVRRVVVAHDCGLIINPDGLKNQIEGNVIQGISRTLIEEVGFNTSAVTTLVWAFQNPAYPVIHFNQLPSSIEIVLLDHPDQLTQLPDTPAWGAGEPTIGPVAPAIANAIYDAIGKRLTVLPITKQRVLAALAGP
jgi:CO/xanthine dehydrogenase Mo-binding subunit